MKVTTMIYHIYTRRTAFLSTCRVKVAQLVMENTHARRLHQCHVQKLWANINRTYAFLHILALAAIFYYRGSFFLNKNDPKYQKVPFLPWLALFVAELILSFLWLLKQPFYWRPVTRTAFPERLPTDEELPGIDVFICTADPEREPTWEVINTVISAMSLDYPVEKLSVYLSDDAGAYVTLKGMKEAWVFATWWLPFCRKYKVKPLSPHAYFEGSDSEEDNHSREFEDDFKIVKVKYEVFKQRVRRKLGREELGDDDDPKTCATNHPALIQVINASSTNHDVATQSNPDHGKMPLLVYVAREKRPSHPHNFKAGALNVLLRTSNMLSNSPYILFLDCDMYCNDSISARQAMCFFLDHKISPSLGWVQFPQEFHNTNSNNIYNGQLKIAFHILWHGADGLQGPVISGTNFYIKREALYGISINDDSNLGERKEALGTSNEFIKSLGKNYKPKEEDKETMSSVLLQEAEFLASCTYEKDTKWGEKVGFRYGSVVEDVMTGFALQGKGWTSVYLNPSRPQFLGSATTNLNDTLTQGIRWVTGLLDISVSQNCPFIYKQSRMQILHKLSSSWILLFPLEFVPISIFAIIPPLCFLYGIPLYPQVSDPFLVAFAFVFLISKLRHLCEFLSIGGSVGAWNNDQLMWMVKAVTIFAYGTLDLAMSKIGLRETIFIPTNKAGDDDKTKYYQMGKYDFRTSYIFLVPIGTLVILNLVCFIGGVARVIIAQNWDIMFIQMIFSLYVLVMSLPVIEGMLLRKDKGRIPISACLTSVGVSLLILNLGYFILKH